MSAAQVGFGLYGPLLVEDSNDGVGVGDQLTLVLSDIGFNANGELEPADSGGSAGMVFGREGNHVLANGRHRPVLKARSGAPQRWRIVNAAKSRFFYLDLDGQQFTVIGSDGGIQEKPTTTRHPADHRRRARRCHRYAEGKARCAACRFGRCCITAATAASNIAASKTC